MQKAQASLEHLVVYGFAMLMVIIAVAALSYSGVIKGDLLSPEKCLFPAGIDCIDKSFTSNLTIALKNNLGKIKITNAVGDICNGNAYIAVGSTNNTYILINEITVPREEVIKISIQCPSNLPSKLKETIQITYKNINSGLTNYVSGEISLRTS